MKKLKSLIAASALALSLSLTAFAGEMGGPGFTDPPPPPPAAASAAEPPAGNLTAPDVVEPGALDAITESALLMIELFASIG